MFITDKLKKRKKKEHFHYPPFIKKTSHTHTPYVYRKKKEDSLQVWKKNELYRRKKEKKQANAIRTF